MAATNRGALRTLLKSIHDLTSRGCHLEARIKLAVSFDLFDISKVLNSLDHIRSIERQLPRQMVLYEAQLTERILRHIETTYGADTRTKIEAALDNQEN